MHGRKVGTRIRMKTSWMSSYASPPPSSAPCDIENVRRSGSRNDVTPSVQTSTWPGQTVGKGQGCVRPRRKHGHAPEVVGCAAQMTSLPPPPILPPPPPLLLQPPYSVKCQTTGYLNAASLPSHLPIQNTIRSQKFVVLVKYFSTQ